VENVPKYRTSRNSTDAGVVALSTSAVSSTISTASLSAKVKWKDSACTSHVVDHNYTVTDSPMKLKRKLDIVQKLLQQSRRRLYCANR
jgi:hypothetical protein